MKKNAIVVSFLFLLGVVQAQEPIEADSIEVSGVVVNAITGEPEPLCLVKLLRDGFLMKGAVCDYEGHYNIGSVHVGVYTLDVSLNGISLSYTELELYENANLSIAIFPDTSQRVIHLQEVKITADRYVNHQLKELLVTQTNDVRLWDFNWRECWRKWGYQPRIASANVATPEDLNPMYDDAWQSIP